MATLTNLLYTARDALSAGSYGVAVAGQNVSNVNTPGYARREVQFETRGADIYGVNVVGSRRVTDQHLERRHFESSGMNSAASERERILAGVETLFNDISGSGIGQSLNAVFSSFGALAANPSDPTARQVVLDSAEAFAGNVREVGDRLAQSAEELLQQARAVAQEINSRSSEIANLNRQIQMTEAQGGDPQNLYDQRNQVLLDLAEMVDIQTFTNGQGGLVVRASGTTLVEGTETRTLSIDLAAGGTMRVLAQRGSGPATEITNYLSGGKLAGIKEARDVDLFSVRDRFDQFVFDVASAVNTQHAAGVGLDGSGGRDIFDVTGPAGAARSLQLSSDVAGQPQNIAASGSATTLPGGSDNAVALANIANQAVVSGNTRSPIQAYSDIVGDVGSRRAQAHSDAQMREALHAQITAMRESVSGVSLEEEMVALTKYQRAYEAAAKVFSTVDQMLEELIARVGR